MVISMSGNSGIIAVTLVTSIDCISGVQVCMRCIIGPYMSDRGLLW